jgi:uncharacterized protein
MKFEWDVEKADANLKKHGVSFEMSRLVFDDPYLNDRLDESADYGEERWISTGLAKGKLIVVVYAMRGETCRIISARKATRIEQQNYCFQA